MQVMIKNRHTDEIKYVPEQTAEMVQNEDWLKKNWEVIERETPPYEVVQFQELKKKEDNVVDVVPEKVEEITEDVPTRDVSKLTVRQVEAEIDSFTTEEMAILVDDPRVSVRRLVNKKLQS